MKKNLMLFDMSTKARRREVELRRKHLKHKYRPRKKIKSKLQIVVIDAPELVCVYNIERGLDEDVDIYRKTIDLINKIRTLQPGRYQISFFNTKRLSVAACLLIYAAIDKILTNEGVYISVRSSFFSAMVNAYLHKTGIKSIVSNRVCPPDFSSGKPLAVVRGYGGEYRDDIVDYICSSVYKNSLSAEQEYRYGDAVQETINNVRLHAYPGLGNAEDKVWWLFCDVIENELFLTIFDQGVGIPNTVVRHGWFSNGLKEFYPNRYNEIIKEVGFSVIELLRGYFLEKGLDDDKLIYISMMGDISSTKEDKHGQGSKSIKALVAEAQHGKLWVYSNRGLYNLNGKTSDEKTMLLPSSIDGTLVQWNIRL